MKDRLIETAQHYGDAALRILKAYPTQVSAAIMALLMGAGGATYAVATLAPDAAALTVRTVVEDVQPLALADTVHEQAMRLYRSETTRSTDTADALLRRLGIFDPTAAAFLRSDRLTQQSVLGRSGRNVTAETAADHSLLQLTARWSPDNDGTFKRLTVTKTATGFQSRLETAPMSASSRLASGIIQSSLFAATDDARIPDSVATQLADIFSGDIDFHRALRKGDRFTVAYETLEGDGEPLRAGRVLSAEFVNAGKTYQALWFQEPASGQARARGGYYNLAGDSLRRAFLASPMEFSRVSSGFKMRFHPILQKWRAHLGVDYAAPSGTPVRAVGDASVAFAGVQNGFGNVVILQHGNNRQTVYAHLSRILVRKGQSVSQGQHIGAVGRTGWATGPHLHYEFRVNGAHRDPLTVARQSEAIPVSASARPAFNQLSAQVRHQLALAADLRPGSAQ